MNTRRRVHWTEYVTYDNTDPRLLGETEHGDLLVPGRPRNGEPYWYGRLNLRNPRHWAPWARSRATKRIAMLEAR